MTCLAPPTDESPVHVLPQYPGSLLDSAHCSVSQLGFTVGICTLIGPFTVENLQKVYTATASLFTTSPIPPPVPISPASVPFCPDCKYITSKIHFKYIYNQIVGEVQNVSLAWKSRPGNLLRRSG